MTITSALRLTLCLLACAPAGCTERATPDRLPGFDAGLAPDDGGSTAPHDGGPSRPPVDSGIHRLPDGAYVCGGEDIALERLPARLVFVVDRSSSTLEPADRSYAPAPAELGSCADTNARPASGITYRTLWDDLGAAIADVAGARDDRVAFGLTLFPGPGEITGAGSGEVFCTARPPVTMVAPALGTATALASTLASPANAPLCAGGFTPTRRALEIAGEALAGASDGVLVLATDGGPNCGAGAPGCACTTSPAFCGTLGTVGCLDDDATVDTIEALRERGIRTYVIGIPGTEAYAGVLSAMAHAGGTARTGDTAYYRADDAGALVAALGTISDREVSCRFALASRPPDLANVNVLLDGEPSPRDDADGWTLEPDGSAIELRGAACEDLRAGSIGRVQFLFGCPPLI